MSPISIRTFCTTIGFTLLASASSLTSAHAEIVASDGSVGTSMNAGGTSSDRAQYVIGLVNPYDHTIWGATYTGNTTSYNQLTIQNGSKLKGQGTAFIGYEAASSYNSAIIQGANSRWEVDTNFFLGYNGSNNSLSVEAGGYFTYGVGGSNLGLMVGYNLGSNNNSITVTGAGSVLTGTYAAIGQEGDSNSLHILNGGSVSVSSFAVGHGNSNISGRGKNNSLVISGSGSTLTTTAQYSSSSVGSFGNNNSLRIEDGGTLNSLGDFYIGSGNENVRSGSNTITVTGSGSKLITEGRFRIGSHGSGNRLIIENGATVVSSTEYATTITTGTLGNANSMLVTGAGTSFTGSILVGERGFDNTLTIQDGASVDGASIIAGDYMGRNNSILITGTGTQVTLTGEFAARSGTSNSITIQNGASVTSGTGTVGYSGTNHSVTVKGDGASWNTTTLSVGSFSSGHALKVENGALLVSVNTGIAEWGSSAKNNTVLVAGEGSVWNNTGNLAFGNYGSDNTITITDKALFSLGGNLEMNKNGGQNNFIRLDGGFFAWAGDHRSDLETLIGQGVFQTWNDTAWSTADVTDFQTLYFLTESEAFDFTGYHDLAGYTILAAIPEPSVWGLSGSAALAAFLIRRRKNRL